MHTSRADAVRIRGVLVLKDSAHLDGTLEILVELTDGTYRTVFSETAVHKHDGPISHYVHARSFTDRPVHKLTDA